MSTFWNDNPSCWYVMVYVNNADNGSAVVVAPLSRLNHDGSSPGGKTNSATSCPTVNWKYHTSIQTAIGLFLKQPLDDGAIDIPGSAWLLFVKRYHSGHSQMPSPLFENDRRGFWVYDQCVRWTIISEVQSARQTREHKTSTWSISRVTSSLLYLMPGWSREVSTTGLPNCKQCTAALRLIVVLPDPPTQMCM